MMVLADVALEKQVLKLNSPTVSCASCCCGVRTGKDNYAKHQRGPCCL